MIPLAPAVAPALALALASGATVPQHPLHAASPPSGGPSAPVAHAGTPRGAPGSPAAALAAARPGDTIRVAAGRHAGPLLIDRPVVLLAEPGAILDGGGTGTVVTIAADSVVLRGFTIVGSGRSLDGDEAAVRVIRCRGCVVADNAIARSLHGIYLHQTVDAVVARNRIDGDASLSEGRRGNGVHLFHSTGSRIERNRIRATRDGIYFSFASGNTVVGNDVEGVRYGLHYMYSDANRFHGNRFRRNAAGAAIMFSRDIVLRENTFADHIGHRAFGILLQSAEAVTVERNRFEGNRIGIFLDMTAGATFRENLVAGNGVGVELLSSAESNTFTGNAFLANRIAVRVPVGAGENRWSAEGRGNYWGDPAVFDLDGDGIGDRPYRASDPFAALAASRPALEVFVGTPAARALSWAERAFPVFRLPAAEDPHPLAHPPAGVPAPAPRRRRRP
ncbi:MAG TPA: nitrous oxide reductase family maturation protein NosD [Longimicrobiales bacterium]